MRIVPLPILRELQFGSPSLVDLIELYISNELIPDMRFAMYDQAITWGGHNYVAAGFKSIVKTRQSIADSLSEIQIAIPDLTMAVSTLLESTDLGGTLVLVRRVLLSRPDGRDSIEFYRGRIRSPVTIEGTTAIISIVPLASDPDELSQVAHRSEGHSCGFVFGGPECGVDLSLFRYDGEVGAGSTQTTIRDSLLTAGAISLLETTYRIGDDGTNLVSALPSVIIGTSGINQGAYRPIGSIQPCRIELRKPFYQPFAEGDTFRIERRCPKTLDACEGFGNLGIGTPQRNGSFAWSPKEPRNLIRQIH